MGLVALSRKSGCNPRPIWRRGRRPSIPIPTACNCPKPRQRAKNWPRCSAPAVGWQGRPRGVGGHVPARAGCERASTACRCCRRLPDRLGSGGKAGPAADRACTSRSTAMPSSWRAASITSWRSSNPARYSGAATGSSPHPRAALDRRAARDEPSPMSRRRMRARPCSCAAKARPCASCRKPAQSCSPSASISPAWPAIAGNISRWLKRWQTIPQQEAERRGAAHYARQLCDFAEATEQGR